MLGLDCCVGFLLVVTSGNYSLVVVYGLLIAVGWEDPLEKEMEPTPVFLPGKSHGQRNLIGYSWAGLQRVGLTE